MTSAELERRGGARISYGPKRVPFRGFEGQVLETRYTYIGKAMTVVFVEYRWLETNGQFTRSRLGIGGPSSML